MAYAQKSPVPPSDATADCLSGRGINKLGEQYNITTMKHYVTH